ncbi:hypothetical protein F9222_24795 [Escherichia coli]|nr:hypothetical protein F9222_24795 [Escherichia coli]
MYTVYPVSKKYTIHKIQYDTINTVQYTQYILIHSIHTVRTVHTPSLFFHSDPKKGISGSARLLL